LGQFLVQSAAELVGFFGGGSDLPRGELAELGQHHLVVVDCLVRVARGDVELAGEAEVLLYEAREVSPVKMAKQKQDIFIIEKEILHEYRPVRVV